MISQRAFTFCCIPAEIYNDTEVVQHHILTVVVVVVYICLRQQISDFFGCLRICKGGGGTQIWYFFGCLRLCKRGKATHMRFLWVFKIVQGGGVCWEIWEELKGGLLNRLKGFIHIVNPNFIWIHKKFQMVRGRNSSWQIFLAANQ